MTVDVTFLGNIVPEYATIDSGRFAALLLIAQSFVAPSRFGTLADYATALMVAHLAKIGDNQGNHVVSEEKDGNESASYYIPPQSSGGDAALSQTSYGLQFIAVRKSILFSSPV
jgi:hypothetical protein